MGIGKERISTQILGRGILLLAVSLLILVVFVPPEVASVIFGTLGISIVILSLVFCMQICGSLEPFEEVEGRRRYSLSGKAVASPEDKRSLYLEYGPGWQETLGMKPRIYGRGLAPKSKSTLPSTTSRTKMSKVTDGIWETLPVATAPHVKVLRGSEFLGNRLRFKAKVLNDTGQAITDIKVWLISYPERALKLISEDSARYPRIEPGGFRSPHFDLLPTQDCVRGDIVAGVSYVDARGVSCTISAMPHTVRAVCDLLKPERITPTEFEEKLASLERGELVVKVSDWTVHEMFEKALRILDDSNFLEIESELRDTEDLVEAEVKGWSRGKYTGKSLGVLLRITGERAASGASCRITMTGEDEAMIFPAIEELRDKLSTWLCPFCGSKLAAEDVKDLKRGEIVSCRFCDTAIVH
ncbi:MAG: hypothetical protein ACFFCK_03090 [Promethearchaeota archaeon]